MGNFRRIFQHLALALGIGISWAAAGASLNVGDPAPKLQTGTFVQGDPVSEFAPGQAYIVEFWATWCSPCRESIPHLNEVYLQYKDKGLVVIGQDCLEQDEAKVAPFIKSMGDQMTYRVALDNLDGDKKGKMMETWMEPAERKGIPSAFLIDKNGNIAWIGHPMALREGFIEAVLAGTYDAKKEAALDQEHEAAEGKIFSKYLSALKAKDWETALSSLDELEKAAPKGSNMVTMMRFKVLVQKQDFSAALKTLTDLAEAHKDQPALQNDLAWTIASDAAIKDPALLKAAETMAQRAVDGAKDDAQKCMHLDTLARVKFIKGNKDEAIMLEQKAVVYGSGPDKVHCQRTLDKYKQGELPSAE